MPVSVSQRFFPLTETNHYASDTASPDDPNEISFTKGEIIEIIDTQGKWWHGKKADGSSKHFTASLLRILLTSLLHLFSGK